jgi:hypothetical protein
MDNTFLVMLNKSNELNVTISYAGGIMESLDNRWILQGNFQQCEQFEKTPNTLGLKNMAGVFILVAAGIVGGIGLIIIEMAYKKHQIRKQKRMELARHAADKWRGAIEVKHRVAGLRARCPFTNIHKIHAKTKPSGHNKY